MAQETSELGGRIEGPDGEGFHSWIATDPGYNAHLGAIRARAEGPAAARVRIATGPARANPLGALHGGFLLSFLDQAIFVGPAALGRIRIGQAVTLNVATQFLAPGRADIDLDALVEIIEETGRLLFVRGHMEQEGRMLLSFQATLRKLSSPPAQR